MAGPGPAVRWSSRRLEDLVLDKSRARAADYAGPSGTLRPPPGAPRKDGGQPLIKSLKREKEGIPTPAGGGTPGRFLTDVIVELGLASRTAGRRSPSRWPPQLRHGPRAACCWRERRADTGRSRPGAGRALWPGTPGPDLPFSVDMSAANLVSTSCGPAPRARSRVSFADEHTLLVAMADPSNVLAIDDLAIMTGYDVRVAVAPRRKTSPR